MADHKKKNGDGNGHIGDDRDDPTPLHGIPIPRAAPLPAIYQVRSENPPAWDGIKRLSSLVGTLRMVIVGLVALIGAGVATYAWVKSRASKDDVANAMAVDPEKKALREKVESNTRSIKKIFKQGDWTAWRVYQISIHMGMKSDEPPPLNNEEETP